MQIDVKELVEEFQKQFPKEFTICVQAIQIRKLSGQRDNNETVEPEETEES